MASIPRKTAQWQPPPARLEGDRLLKEAAAASNRFKTAGELLEEQRADAPKAFVSPIPGISPELPDYVPSEIGALKEALLDIAKDVEEIKHRPAMGGAVYRRARVSEAAVRNAVLIDEDDFASNSDQEAPTQQSAKAYVDGATGPLMRKSVYDPTNVAGDAFDMDNMAEGADTKILTAAERAAIAAASAVFPATRTVLKALDTTKNTVAFLKESGREGQFIFRTGDYSTQIAADTLEGIYIKADAIAATAGAWVRAEVTAYRPQYFGAVGGPTVDATPAINACFAMARFDAANASYGGANIPTPIDLSGFYWRLDDTINATNITAYNLRIIGGALLGHCTGKPMIDLVGSRGWTMYGTNFYGDETDRPSDAYIIARSTVTGACDSIKMDHVSTTGWFSRSVGVCYAHEGGVHEHCNYANYDHEATNTIFQGVDLFAVTSEFTTAVTGHQSFILNKVSNTTFQMGSPFATRTITNITKAASAVITFSAPHPYVVGKDIVILDDTVVGMTEMNGRYMTITASTSTTVTVDVDSTAFTTYVSGGTTIHRNEQPTVYLGRADQFSFDRSYIVSWGNAKIQLFGADGYGGRFIDLDLCMEGSGSDADVEFSTGGAFVCAYYGFSLKTYSSAANSALFFNTYSGTGFVALIKPRIESVTPRKSQYVMNPLYLSTVSMQNGDILTPNLAAFAYASLSGFSGTIADISNGNVYHRNIAVL